MARRTRPAARSRTAADPPGSGCPAFAPARSRSASRSETSSWRSHSRTGRSASVRWLRSSHRRVASMVASSSWPWSRLAELMKRWTMRISPGAGSRWPGSLTKYPLAALDHQCRTVGGARQPTACENRSLRSVRMRISHPLSDASLRLTLIRRRSYTGEPSGGGVAGHAAPSGEPPVGRAFMEEEAARVASIDVRLVDVTKSFGPDMVAVDHVSLDVMDGEFFSLLGPSGCGKTTTLRMIGGFEEPTSGLIELHGEDVTWLPPYKRNVNTVFQNYALFPHLTIFENVAFGLRRKKVGGDEVKRRVAEMLDLVELQRLRQAQARPDLRRPGAARGARAGAHQSTGRAAPGRAARRPRPQAAQADADRAQAHPAGSGHHLHLRDPRPGRGDDDVRSHRRHEPRPLRAAGLAGGALRAPHDPLRGQLPRCQQPAAGHRRRSAPAPSAWFG